jgi:hypothetical protein
MNESGAKQIQEFKNDWNLFAKEVLKVNLDADQKAILKAVQTEKMVSVRSGTSRGKDFVGAVAAMCFMYLTPVFKHVRTDEAGVKEWELKHNTKVALTAPTDRQIRNIMYPEISRLFRRSKGWLPGRLVGYDIRTPYSEWFLTGFKADEHNTEAWTGFHASNVMFVVTEASGIAETIYEGIEGNLQGNSRLLLIFNPNRRSGYAYQSQNSTRFKKFALNSLNATNVLEKKIIIPGQVDYEWIKDKVNHWCTPIEKKSVIEASGDFEFEGKYYHPNDIFRVKVLAMFPETDSSAIVPTEWIEQANKRHREWLMRGEPISTPAIYGVDIAGMGRDTTVICERRDNFVKGFDQIFSQGKFQHMEIAGRVLNLLKEKENKAHLDTIGEGAGVYSRLEEQRVNNAFSCKASNMPTAKDETGQHEFVNMRAQAYWSLRDWLNPQFNNKAMLPEDDELMEELSSTNYVFDSRGRIQIESKDKIKKKIGRSPDKADSLSLTFYPTKTTDKDVRTLSGLFH